MRISLPRRRLTIRRDAGDRLVAEGSDGAARPIVGYEDFRAVRPDALRAKLAGDRGEMAHWVRSAAHHGVAEAQLMLGQLLLDGTGVQRDHAAALRWFRRAAEAGLADAMNMIGRCHELGWGVPPDPAVAASWYRRAAERDLAWGQFNIANMLLYGIGVPRDRPAALGWYRRAAAQGHAKSMNLLGRFLEEGWDCAADPHLARTWYRRSAEAGDFRGQFNLATLLMKQGQAAEASRWFRAAIDSGSPDFLLAAGHALSAHADRELRELGRLALDRVAGTGFASPVEEVGPA